MGVAALLLGVAAPLEAAAPAAGPVVVPTFIDPHRPIEVPPGFGHGHVIRFLTTDDHPPFNFTAPDGTLAGFNIDLARALCAVLDAVCSIQARSFESLVPALVDGQGDAVIASLAITPASRAIVDFSSTTMRMTARFASRATQGPETVLPETVSHLVIGVQAGTAHEAYLRHFFPQAVVTPFTDPESLRESLRAGRIDLLFADGLATALWLNGSAAAGCCRFAGGAFTESRYFGEGSGIAIRKGDDPLRQALDDALQRVTADGTAGDLYLKYFPVGFF